MSNASSSDIWAEGNPYERYVGRWSRLVADQFLRWLAAPPGQVWLDIGCGTGALVSEILAKSAPKAVFGVEPSEGFLALARASLKDRATLLQGEAAQIPLPDAGVDIAVSGLVLNFVPDLGQGLAEISRTVRPGGTVAAYVWDYAQGMELMRYFWDAAASLDPNAAALDEGVRFPLCRPSGLASAFVQAGLSDVEVVPLNVATPFRDFEDYWAPFLGGQGPAPAYACALDDAARERLRDRLRERLPGNADGSITLTARAWAVKGTRDL